MHISTNAKCQLCFNWHLNSSMFVQQAQFLDPCHYACPTELYFLAMYYPLKNNTRCSLLTLPCFNSYFCYSSISHPFASTDLWHNPLGNDLSQNLSFGHQRTYPIIDPNIEKFQKGQHLGHTIFENFRHLHTRIRELWTN